MTTYAEKLRDPRWQRVRLEKLAAAEWRCECCGDKDTMLSVHHKRYVKGRAPWEYPVHELAVLCQPCHEEHHQGLDTYMRMLAPLPVDGGPCSVQAVYEVAAGYVIAARGAPAAVEVAGEIECENPFTFACGYAAAAFIAGKLTVDGIHRFADALAGEGQEDLAADLNAVFEKHGLLARHSGL